MGLSVGRSRVLGKEQGIREANLCQQNYAASFHGCGAVAIRRSPISIVEQLESRVMLSVAYAVTDLGGFGGSTYATAINDAGQIVGGSAKSGTNYRPFLWAAHKITEVAGSGAGTFATANAINNKGEVVVAVQAIPGSAIIANGKMTTDLGVLPGYQFTVPLGINSAGQVVGYCVSGNNSRAFLYTGGKITDLGKLLPGDSVATAINDAGQIVGYARSPLTGSSQAFLYSSGIVKDLGSTTDSFANAIDSNGDVVGMSGGKPFLYTKGGIVELGGGAFGDAVALNGPGEVVGSISTPNDPSRSHAALFTASGTTIDLNDLIDPSLGIALDTAVSVNSSGQIAANGFNRVQGIDHAFLLTPVPSGSISGTIFNDLNANATREPGEPGVAGRTVYIDANHNGTLDATEFSTVTHSGGKYTFTGLGPGTFNVSQVQPTSWQQTTPRSAVKLAAGQNAIAGDIGDQQLFLYALTDFSAGHLNVAPSSINSAGEIVGTYSVLEPDGVSTHTDGFLYDTGLFTAFGGSNVRSVTINDAGQINGYADDANLNPYYFLFSHGKLTASTPNTPTIPGDTGHLHVVVNTVNARGNFGGALVLSGDKGGDTSLAFVDIGARVMDISQYSIAFSGSSNGDLSAVLALNDHDQAVGYGSGGGFLFRNGQFQWLAGMGTANDINNRGQIAGSSERPNFTDGNALLYSGGRTVNMNDAVDGVASFRLNNAVAINDAGWIAATGFDARGIQHAFLLKPVTATVTGSVFNDLNSDGKRQAGEPPLKGVRVYADLNYNHRWDPGEPTATTDAAGNYALSGLSAGGYVIRQLPPNGWIQTAPAGDNGMWVDLSPGQSIPMALFGERALPATAAGVVFNDANGDGIRQPGEVPLAGVRVYLDLNANHSYDPGEPSAVTDSSGAYTITNVVPGNYTVRQVTPADWRQTTPASRAGFYVQIRAGQNVSIPIFGETKMTASPVSLALGPLIGGT